MSRRKAFTIMELLVVISIVALLTSIILPAASNVKAKLRSTMCTSNLQQLGRIFNLYTLDNDGKFMERGCGRGYGAVSWFHCIRNYHDPNDDLIFCPLAVDTPSDGGRNPYMAWENTTDFGVHYEGSYGINLWVANGGSCADDPCDFDSLCWVRTPTVSGAAYVPLLLCSQWKDMQPHATDEPLPYESYVWTPGWQNEMRRPCIKRHAPYYVNVLFLDSAVDRRTIKELWRLKWHRNWSNDFPLPIWPETGWMDDVPEPD
jgi:prepilin-type N-terminal cleavage/methylation domain-containing protein